MRMLRVFHAMLFLSFAAPLPAQSNGAPDVVTTSDLSEHNGIYTWIRNLTSGSPINVQLNLADIFSTGADLGIDKGLELDLSSLSDPAPTCGEIAAQLNIQGGLSCSISRGGSYIDFGSSGAPLNNCWTLTRDIYRTETICEEVPIKPSCVEGGRRGRGQGRDFETYKCPTKKICEDIQVYVRTDSDQHCEESTFALHFTADGFEIKDSPTSISSTIRINSLKKTTVKSVNSVIRSTRTESLPSSDFVAVPSQFHFTLKCADGTPVGGPFNTLVSTVSYRDIVNACGDQELSFTSNRSVVFDRAALILRLDKP